MKILRTLLIGIPLSCFTLNTFAAATWVDNRYAHTTASEKISIKLALVIYLIMAQGCWPQQCMTSDKILIK
jgi:hypothetical protein